MAAQIPCDAVFFTAGGCVNLKTQASWMWATLVRLLVARCSSPALVVGGVLAQAIIRRYGELMETLNRYLR